MYGMDLTDGMDLTGDGTGMRVRHERRPCSPTSVGFPESAARDAGRSCAARVPHTYGSAETGGRHGGTGRPAAGWRAGQCAPTGAERAGGRRAADVEARVRV